MSLTPKQQLFVAEYLVDLNATQAAVRAGYSAKTAYSVGHENLKKPEVAAAIQEAMEVRSQRTEIAQGWILEQLKLVYEASIEARPVYDRNGKEKGFSFNPAAANRALELLGKHRGMFRACGLWDDADLDADLLDAMGASEFWPVPIRGIEQ